MSRIKSGWVLNKKNPTGRQEWKIARPGSIHDTEEITYRCFLPDLTRFMAFCYEATGQNNPYRPAQPEDVFIVGLV